MADYLPEGVISNILIRLDVKTILQCTCVCKSWYTLITCPQFIYAHLNFTNSSTKRSLAPIVQLSSDTNNIDAMRFYAAAESGLLFKNTKPPLSVIGSCNGLLCLSDDRDHYTHAVIIWNPCVERSVLLPRPKLVYNLCGRLITQWSLGFGYDCVTDDYKVVCIKYVDHEKVPPQVELYRLSTGVWHDISGLGFQHVIHSKSRHAYIHGANHWIACCANSYDLIVLFDMCGEVFREMRLPDIHTKCDQRVEKDMVVCMGSLALITHTEVENLATTNFSVWVMNEYGVVKSWTKHFGIDVVGMYAILNMPLWVRKFGQYVAIFGDAKEVTYSSQDGAGIDLRVIGSRLKDYQRSAHVETYTESLVLLERGTDLCDAVTSNRLRTFGSSNRSFIVINRF